MSVTTHGLLAPFAAVPGALRTDGTTGSGCAAIQVVGFGASALGIPIAGERIGMLRELLEAGLVFIERSADREELANSRFRWSINSNSPGDEFVRAIPLSGPFSKLPSTDSYCRLTEHKQRPVPLRWVSALLADIQHVVLEELERHPASGFKCGSSVARVQFDGAGCLVSYDQCGRPIARSRSLVFANGARERSINVGPHALTLHSGQILRREWGELPGYVARGARIEVFGGSHSAFSVATVLLEAFRNQLEPGQIAIRCNNVKLFYASMLEATRAGHRYHADELDPETYQLNRFDGLRGDARALHTAITCGREARVAIRPLQEGPADPNRVVVFAAGYETERIPLFDVDGDEIQLATKLGTVELGGRGELLDEQRRVIPNLFGIGIGYAPNSRVGARVVGLNIFHGPAAEVILRAVQAGSRHDLGRHLTQI